MYSSFLTRFDASVSNNGNIDAYLVQGYYIYEYCDIEFCYDTCEYFSIPRIEAQKSVLVSNLSVPYNTNYFLIIDPANLIPELNETNNEKCSGRTCKSPPALDICY